MRRGAKYSIVGGVAAVVVATGATVALAWPAPKLVHDVVSRAPTRDTVWAEASFAVTEDHFSVIMDGNQCVTRPVRITSIELYRPSAGIRLVDWGISNGTDDLLGGPQPGVLRGHPSRSMTTRCGTSAANIGIELRRTGPGPQSFLGLRITYPSSGHTVTAYFPESFRITR